MKICVAGQGAFGQKHLDALKRIPDVEVTSLVGGNQDATAEVAKKYGIPHYTGDLSEGIKRADAVILTTPTKMHFRQGEQVMRAGKHVLVEIPVTDSVEDADNLVKIAKETGVVAMGGHVRRFNPSHQYVHKKIVKGELKIQQMDVQTYFFRRKNMNAAGNARSWTDHLLWHHAAHTVDLFQYQVGETISDGYAVQGPIHPHSTSPWTWASLRKVPSGAILTLSLSFNNDALHGSFFRYIGDNGTFKAYYDDLSDGKDNKIDVSKVDVSMDGIELEDREFIAAIKEKREPERQPRTASSLHARARQARKDHRSAAQGARVSFPDGIRRGSSSQARPNLSDNRMQVMVGIRLLGILVALLCLPAQHAGAQASFPSNTVKIVVPYAAGGGTDIVARILANRLQQKWGKNVVVENRAGAGGNVGAEAVATADADGHTLLFAAQGPFAVNKPLYGKLNYDPEACAGLLGCHRQRRHTRQSERAGEKPDGAGRLCEAKAAQLRVAGDRDPGASGSGAVQVHDRHRHAARTLQGQRPGVERSGGRSRRGDVLRARALGPLHPVRPVARLGDQQREAARHAAGCADGGGEHPRLHCAVLVGDGGAAGDAGRRHRQDIERHRRCREGDGSGAASRHPRYGSGRQHARGARLLCGHGAGAVGKGHSHVRSESRVASPRIDPL